jgi:hypothetical protein
LLERDDEENVADDAGAVTGRVGSSEDRPESGEAGRAVAGTLNASADDIAGFVACIQSKESERGGRMGAGGVTERAVNAASASDGAEGCECPTGGPWGMGAAALESKRYRWSKVSNVV